MSSSVVGPGQVIAGRYRIEGWLGQGGMGSVYRALQLSVQRTVALKRLVDEHLQNASHVERFEREALALSRLSHQSTVRLFDFGSDERGCPFIVMEYLDGVDLATDLERHGPMRWDQALQVSLQVLGSLDEAHAAGIVHRDIKPANLFLCVGPEWPSVKVLDFGIAGGAEPTADARKLTLTGTVLGSAPYMSPEQARGLAVTPSADLYSFGVVLFEMLTGKTPFEARTLTAQLLAKVLEPAPALRSACPELDAPPEVHALVAALLEREPERRPSSARATAETIMALLARSALPPLARAAQRAKRSPVTARITKTVPMLVPPRTLDERLTPPAPTERGGARSRAGLAWALLLAASGVGAAAWVSSPSIARELRASVSAPVPAQLSGEEARPAEIAAISPNAGSYSPRVDWARPSDPAGPRQLVLSGVASTGVASTGLLAAELATEVTPRSEPVASGRAKTPKARPRRELPERGSGSSRVEQASTARSAPIASGSEPSPSEPSQQPGPSSAAASPAPISALPASTSPASTSPPVTPDRLLPGAVVAREPAAPDAEPVEPSGAPAASPSAPEAQGTSEPSSSEPSSSEPPITEAAASPAPSERPPAHQRNEPRHSPPISDPSYWTITAARAAARSGEITPAQRNEIVAALQQRRLSARARAARAYRQGRIGFEELLERQRSIDRRIEGW